MDDSGMILPLSAVDGWFHHQGSRDITRILIDQGDFHEGFWPPHIFVWVMVAHRSREVGQPSLWNHPVVLVPYVDPNQQMVSSCLVILKNGRGNWCHFVNCGSTIDMIHDALHRFTTQFKDAALCWTLLLDLETAQQMPPRIREIQRPARCSVCFRQVGASLGNCCWLIPSPVIFDPKNEAKYMWLHPYETMLSWGCVMLGKIIRVYYSCKML
jgi:hypothetical protein